MAVVALVQSHHPNDGRRPVV